MQRQQAAVMAPNRIELLMLRVVHISIRDCIKNVFVISTAGRNLFLVQISQSLCSFEMTKMTFRKKSLCLGVFVARFFNSA